MWLAISILIVAVVAVGLWIRKAAATRQLADVLLSLKPQEEEFRQALAEFAELDRRNWYFSDRLYRLWKAKYRHLADKCPSAFAQLKLPEPFKTLVSDFVDRYFNGRRLIDSHNENFVRQEAPTIMKILDQKGIRHNHDQVNAIASDEDNTLLVAGAGTGKTTTILGKLAYLDERAKVKPEEILLLSFTGRAVDELSERIAKHFPGKSLEVLTFHSFGFSIIGKVLGKKPDLAFESTGLRQQWLDEQFDTLLNGKGFLQLAIEYFAYYFKPVILKPGFQSLDEYYNYSKTETHLTLRKEQLRSQQEVMIANFLYLNGVKYEYERPYPFETANQDYRQYKPDFYLPDYKIYLEHFGVGRDGNTHFTQNAYQNATQTAKYREGMAWKRALHARHKTILIETFSYEFTERTWKTKLTEQLTARGVKFSPPSLSDIIRSIRENGSVKQITQLIGTFLDLAKSNSFGLEKLRSTVAARNNNREHAFIELLAPVYTSYENYLNQRGTIDFHDMLIKAAEFIRAGRYRANYRYIIIDEFQDFSVSKYILVKALCEQNPDTKLFCVGDDWQSIFRFAGSDVSLMTNFESSYGFTRKNFLMLTNRFRNGLALISNRFILKNPKQIRKDVRSDSPDPEEPIEVRHQKNKNDADALLQEILDGLNQSAAGAKQPATIFLLGRYKHNKPENFAAYSRRYGNLVIEYLTIHASKGSEADYVIILDVISGRYGFPSEITDDPLLEIVLSKADSYPHAEERRLMYVALTRARRKVFVLTTDGQESPFVLELEGSNKPIAPGRVCPDCGGEMVERSGPYGTFLGCTNFPECTSKASNQSRPTSRNQPSPRHQLRQGARLRR